MSTADPLRYARRLRDEADVVRVRAHGMLAAGDLEAYNALCSREAKLVRASGWAAVSPMQGPQLLAEHALELPEREAPTTKVRRSPST